MKSSSLAAVTATLLGLLSAACTVHSVEPPGLTGPSEFALSLSMNATPDSINQDGGSQSAIRVSAKGPDGQPRPSLSLRVDMQVNGVVQDFGSLSARSIVTGSDGTATVVYTAPPQNPSSITPTCGAVPGQCVTIVATPTGTDFQTSNSQIVVIRLVPPGVILPPASTPTPQFTINPATLNMNVFSRFDASSSCGGPLTASGACGSNSAITSYVWDFGDGGTATGRAVDYRYGSTGTFTVTLTVTNDRGIAASLPRTVTVGTSDAPAGDWVKSPVNPVVGDNVLFNAETVQPAPGRRIVDYSWNFGDNTPTASGVRVNHTFTVANQYTVVLTVTDDAGQKSIQAQSVTVGTGAPVVVITFSPGSPTSGTLVTFDSSGTTTSGGATISSYAWTFGDGNTATSGPTATNTYTTIASVTRTVRLTVIDSLGRTGTGTVNVTITP